jgi:hypothetical protein
MVDAEFEQVEQAFGSSLLRHLVVLPIWGLRFIAGPVWVLGVDAVLAVLYPVWVNAPLKRALGSRFGKPQHWSGFAELPWVVLLILAVIDCVRFVRG